MKRFTGACRWSAGLKSDHIKGPQAPTETCDQDDGPTSELDITVELPFREYLHQAVEPEQKADNGHDFHGWRSFV